MTNKIYDELLNSISTKRKSTMNFTAEGDWPKYTAITMSINKNNLSNDEIFSIKRIFNSYELSRKRVIKEQLKEMDEKAFYPEDDKISIRENLDVMLIEFPDFLISEKCLIDNNFNNLLKKNVEKLTVMARSNESLGKSLLRKINVGQKDFEKKKIKMMTQMLLNVLFNNEEVRNLVLIKTAIQSVYASQRDYDGVSNTIIASSGFLPSNMNVEAGRIDNTWRNEIIIYNWGPGPNPKPSKSFSIVTIVPKNVCEKVVQGLVAAFDYVDIDTAYMVRSWNTNEPVNATQILAGCTAAGATARIQLGSK